MKTKKWLPLLLSVAALVIVIIAIELHKKNNKASGGAPNVAPRPSLKNKLEEKTLSVALNVLIPKLNKKAPALLSNIAEKTIKPLNLPKLIDPSGNGIALPIPSPYGTIVDTWIDNPITGALDAVLGPILKAVGLKGAELQNVLPAAGSCAGCFGSSPIHLFVNNLKIKDISGLNALKIIDHSVLPPNALKLVVGVDKDTDVKVSLSGSLDLKHKCSKCIGSDGGWKLISSASNIAVSLTLKKGELATACASYDLAAPVPVTIHSLAPSPSAPKPILKITSLSIGKGNSENALDALAGILKLFGSSEEKLVNKIAATVTGPLLKTALDEGKNAINNEIKDGVKSFCSKPPGPKFTAPIIKHLATCKTQGKPAAPQPIPAACVGKEKFYSNFGKLNCTFGDR
jgi:hypothetical protein